MGANLKLNAHTHDKSWPSSIWAFEIKPDSQTKIHWRQYAEIILTHGYNFMSIFRKFKSNVFQIGINGNELN